LIGGNAPDPLDVGLVNPQRIRERRGLAAQQRLARVLHAPSELVTVTLDVLVHGTLDQFGLLEPRHQCGVANLLLGGLVDLDR
jgi:hypothetical protein